MPRSRRERLRAQTFNEIKQIARYQLREVGPSGISLRAIARDMGMSSPAIYRYFSSYSDLITSLIVDAHNALADALEKADRAALNAASGSEPRAIHRQRLEAVATAYRQWATAWPQDYALIFGSPIPNYSPPNDGIAEAERAREVLFGILQSAHDEQLLFNHAESAPNVAQVGVIFLTALEGLVSAELSNRFGGVSAECFPIMLNQQIANLGL